MALGILAIIYIALMVMGVGVQALLYTKKSNNNNLIFVVNMLLGLVVSFLVYSSLPSNFTGQKTLAVVWGIIAILGMIVKWKKEELIMLSRIMLTVSVVGSLIQLVY